MEITEPLATFLISLGICTPKESENRYFISQNDFDLFKSGQTIIQIIKHFPLAESASSQTLLKNLKSNSAKLYNWKIIFKTLQSINISLDPDTQQNIINGDPDFILSLVQKLMKRYKKLGSPKVRSKLARVAPDGALYIESLDPKCDLNSTSSCLEFLILSFCQSFEISPKQAAGLLTQNNKFLAHVLVKGLKGNHEKVQDWYNLVLSKFNRIKHLIEDEIAKGSLQLVLNALKPGFLSKQNNTIEKCVKVVRMIYTSISAKDLWMEWFYGDTLEICLIALKRGDEYLGNYFSQILLDLSCEQVFEIVNENLKKYLNEPEMLKVHQNLYVGLTSNKEKFRESGLVDSYLNFALNTGTVKEKNGFSLAKLNLLVCLWRDFYEDIRDSATDILLEAKRILKDCSVNTKFLILGQFFDLLILFHKKKLDSAAIILKTLIFSLIENYENETLREFILQNFIFLLETIDTLPVFSMLDPLLKQIQYFNSIRFNVIDHEFFLTASRHPRISIDNLVVILDIVSKVFVEDLLFSKACEFTIIYIIGAFFDKTPVAEFTFRLCDLTFSMIAFSEIEKFSKPEKKKEKNLTSSEIESSVKSAHRKSLVLSLFTKLIKLKNPYLNEHIKGAALQNHWSIKKATNSNCKGFEVLLDLLGDSHELIKEFEISSIVPYQEVVQEQNLVQYKPAVVSGRALEDIEKIKNQRKAALERKLKKEEETKKKQQKLYETAKNSVISKFEQIRITEKAEDVLKIQVEYFDLTIEPKNEQDLIEKISKRFALPLKLLFNKYCKPIIKKQLPDLNAFDENSLNEAQIMNFLKGEMIVPQRIKREDALWIIKETFKRDQSSSSFVKFSRKSFNFLVFQISANIFKNDDIYESSPLALRFFEMINYLKSLDKNPKIYDEPDPGAGDREVINYINEKLKIDPGFALPPSIFKCTEYDFQVIYKLPELKIKKSQKISVEILDFILNKALKFHFLRPTFIATPITIARGVNIADHPGLPVLPLYLSVSVEVKYEILKLSEKLPLDLLVESGKVLEDLISSAVTGNNFKSWQAGNTAKNSFLKQRELENLEIENRKAKSEALRRQRKIQLEEYLKQKKRETEEKEEKELREKEEKMQIENKKQMEAEEKRQKEKTDKKKLIEEWKNKKQELETAKNEKELKKKEKVKVSKSASQSILPLLTKKIAEIPKVPKKSEQLAPPSPKSKPSAINLSKVLSESKKVIESELKRKDQFSQFYQSEPIKSAISEYSKSLRSVFMNYLKMTMNTSDPESGINLKGFLKLCLDYSLHPGLVSSSFLTSSFNRVTKEKQKFISFEDFLEILSEVAFSSAEGLKEHQRSEALTELFLALMRYMKISPEGKTKKK